MFTKGPLWYRNVALAGLGISILMVPSLEALQHAHLAAFFHIPLMILILNAMAGGAMVAGVCFCEYQQRAKNLQKAV